MQRSTTAHFFGLHYDLICSCKTHHCFILKATLTSWLQGQEWLLAGLGRWWGVSSCPVVWHDTWFLSGVKADTDFLCEPQTQALLRNAVPSDGVQDGA